MHNLGATLLESIKCAWELPKAPSATIRRFADHAGAMSIAIGVILLLAAFSSVVSPVSLTSDAENLTQLDYSLANLFIVFVQTASVSLIMLASALTLAWLLGTQLPMNRLAFARLTVEGFAAVWFAFHAVLDRNFAFLGEPLMWLVLPLIAYVFYLLWLGYVVGAGFTVLKASVATGVEFLLFMVMVLFVHSLGTSA
ncbi:MAG: hypothetical protein ACRCU5_11875 [Rhizobiaceae bacterium]